MKNVIAIGKGVQFNGPEEVVNAYESRKLPDFALWCGKQFLFTYEDGDIDEGKNTLEAWLDNLKNSAATYTLTVYKQVPEEGITASTPYHGSFNFRLQEKPATYLGNAYGQVGGNWQYMVKELEDLRVENKTLKARVAELEAELEEIEEEKSKGIAGTLGSMATDVINSDEVVGAISQGIAGWISKIINPASTGSPRALAGAELLQWQMKASDAEAAQVNQALNVLFTVEGVQVPAMLTMLADMATKNPPQFITYVEMFKAMAK